MKNNFFITGFFLVFMAAAGNPAHSDLLYPDGGCIRSDGALVAPCCRTAIDGVPYVNCRCPDKNIADAAQTASRGVPSVKRSEGVTSSPLKDEYQSYENADNMPEDLYVGGYWEDDNSYVAIYYRASTDSNYYDTCRCADDSGKAVSDGRSGAVSDKNGGPVNVWDLKDEYRSERIWEGSLPGEVHVGGYWRSDGIYVGIYHSADPSGRPFNYHVCPIDPATGKAAPESANAYSGKQPSPAETWGLRESYDDFLTQRSQTIDVYAGGYWRSDGVHVTAYYRTVPFNNSEYCDCPFNRNPETEKAASENMNAYTRKPTEQIQTWELKEEYKNIPVEEIPYIINYHGDMWRNSNPPGDSFPYYRVSRFDSYYY